jgi:hypothetical protein
MSNHQKHSGRNAMIRHLVMPTILSVILLGSFPDIAFAHCPSSPGVQCNDDGGAHHCAGASSDPGFCGGLIQDRGTVSAVGVALQQQQVAASGATTFHKIEPISSTDSLAPLRLTRPPGAPSKMTSLPTRAVDPSQPKTNTLARPMTPEEFARQSPILNDLQARDALREYADSLRSMANDQGIRQALKDAGIQNSGRVRHIVDLETLESFRQLKIENAVMKKAEGSPRHEISVQLEQAIDGAHRNAEIVIDTIEQQSQLFRRNWGKDRAK